MFGKILKRIFLPVLAIALLLTSLLIFSSCSPKVTVISFETTIDLSAQRTDSESRPVAHKRTKEVPGREASKTDMYRHQSPPMDIDDTVTSEIERKLVDQDTSALVSTPKVRYTVKPLDLSRPPTTEELMAAGQLGGLLYPTEDIEIDANKVPEGRISEAKIKRNQAINLSFGEAIQEWNKHNYKHAVELFRKHVADYTDTPWASEAVLHIGCDATYNGRYTEAEERFNWVITMNRGKNHLGAKALLNKAIQRLAVLKIYQSNLAEAKILFRDLKRGSGDWRERTYAAHWIQRLSRYSKNALAMLNCGVQALAYLLEKDGREAEARKVSGLLPESTQGHSIKDLSDIASRFGYSLTAIRLSLTEIRELPLPSIMHISAKNQNDSGHYWILERLSGDTLSLIDPQAGRRFQQGLDEFSREWSGNALVFSPHPSTTPTLSLPLEGGGKKGRGEGKGERPFTDYNIPGVRLSEKEMKEIYGGCCGVPRPEDDQGDPCKEGGGSAGAPSWKVNMFNMNLYVSDTPLWYDSPIGPPVEITLNYNSQSAIAQHEPFGNKWQFNYGSYLIVDTSGEVIIFMPDGRRDVHSPDGSGGHTRPYQVFNTLTKIAENHFELKFPDGTVYVYKIPPGTTSLQPFLTEIRDRYGQRLRFGYDSNVQLTTITDAKGRVTTLSYNTEGLVNRVTEPFGRSATFEYDANSNLIKITDMGGYWSRFSYDKDIYLTGIENEKGRWGFYIEPSDEDSKNSDNYPPPGDSMWENYRITITNPLGGKEEYFYYGGCDEFTCSGSTWYVSPRDYIPWQSQEVNNFRSNTPKTRYYFTQTSGQRSEINKVLYPGGGSIEYGYDTLTGDLTRDTDSHDHTTYYTYNNMGRVTSITDAKGSVTNMTYVANGVDLLEIKDGLGAVTMTYNSTHDITSRKDRMGNTTNFTYNNYGQIVSISDPLGWVTGFAYDSNSRLQQVMRDGKIIGSFTYDVIDRIRTYTDPTGLILTYDYNNLDKIIKITYPDNKFISINYSGSSPHILDSIKDRSGRVSSFSYDKADRLIETVNPEGGITKYTFDANGKTIRFIDTNGNPTTFEYERENRLVKKTYANGKFLSFTYDNAGLLITRTNARGIDTGYSYDENHNLLSLNYSDNTPLVEFQYDNYDRRSQMVDGIGTYKYSYDANSRLSSIDEPWVDDVVTFHYDALYNITGIIPQGGQSISYIYDALNRLSEIQVGTKRYTYSYSNASPMVQGLTRPNGTNTSYQYDALNRLIELTNRNSEGGIVNRYVYPYNQQDLRSSEIITDGTPVSTFNNEKVTYDYNAINQLLSSTNPDMTFTYDDDGNMTRGYTPEGHIFRAFYDAENRLSSLEYTDSSGVTHKTDYFYTGEGMLGEIKRYEDGSLVNNIRFVPDGILPFQERDGGDNITSEYIWWLNMAGGIGGLLNLRQNGQDFSYLYDGKGNVTALLDGSESVVATYAYDTFGNMLSRTGTLTQPYQFSTKAYNEKTGLSYYGYRFYCPSVGRWVTRDPLGEEGGINLYEFVNSNPVNLVDPFGLQSSPDAGTSLTPDFLKSPPRTTPDFLKSPPDAGETCSGVEKFLKDVTKEDDSKRVKVKPGCDYPGGEPTGQKVCVSVTFTF